MHPLPGQLNTQAPTGKLTPQIGAAWAWETGLAVLGVGCGQCPLLASDNLGVAALLAGSPVPPLFQETLKVRQRASTFTATALDSLAAWQP